MNDDRELMIPSDTCLNNWNNSLQVHFATESWSEVCGELTTVLLFKPAFVNWFWGKKSITSRLPVPKLKCLSPALVARLASFKRGRTGALLWPLTSARQTCCRPRLRVDNEIRDKRLIHNFWLTIGVSHQSSSPACPERDQAQAVVPHNSVMKEWRIPVTPPLPPSF